VRLVQQVPMEVLVEIHQYLGSLPMVADMVLVVLSMLWVVMVEVAADQMD
jgi:hypothetical protein